MTAKILVANDSATIQKVVSMTLSETPYEITECLNEEDLFNQIKESSIDLILLDNSLSEHMSGCELSKKIISIIPNQLIMLMLETFDSVSDGELERCGAKDKIVMPFDGQKLIEKCMSLVEGDDALN